jgi:pimeloyl-ACP methyl ester carboxylesterase
MLQYRVRTTVCMLLLMLLMANVNAQSVKTTTRFGENPAAGNFIEIRGFKMYYEVYGKGEPVIFIHGNGGSISAFRNQIPYFSKKYKVIIADSRARGKSVDNTDSLSYEMMADDYAAFIEKLGLKQAYVVGWSDGGINGLLLAMRHPEKVIKLAVTGANLWPDTTAVFPYIVNMSLNAADSLSKLKINSDVKKQLKLARLLAYQPNIKVSELRKIKCPSLIIGGDHDVIRPEHTLAIARGIPSAYAWIVPNSGHSTPFTSTDLFNTTIDTFFKQPYRKIEGMSMMFY